MRKSISIILIISLLFVTGCNSLTNTSFQRLWKDNLYVQIGEPFEVENTTLSSGEIASRYWYELPAFDKDGERVEVRFSATRELLQDAYLMLYVRKEDEVTSYDEVEWDNIPARAQEQME